MFAIHSFQWSSMSLITFVYTVCAAHNHPTHKITPLCCRKTKQKKNLKVFWCFGWDTSFQDEATPSRRDRNNCDPLHPKKRHKNLGSDLLSAAGCAWEVEDLPEQIGSCLEKDEVKQALQHPFELREDQDQSTVYYGGENNRHPAGRNTV